ncbi:MAG: hypothetical protein JNM36_17275 [Chitinophagales bacterium]|jgi:hypothetical protein|nr:hypothetical protein [Chitinophagales bacterium]
MNKKIFLILFTFLAIGSLFVACDKEQDDLVTASALEGGLVEPQKTSLNYVVGNEKPDTVRIKVLQGEVKTVSVDVYKQFFSTTLGNSQKLKLTTITPSSTEQPTLELFTYTFAQLREGLTLPGGAVIPEDDSQLNIGDKWILTYVGNTSEGNAHENATATASTSVTVSSRFAGTYEVIASDYWRIGVQSAAANWVGSTRIIESVDATTYKHLGWGPFELADDARAFFYFTISPASLSIDYLAEFNGAAITGLGTYLITCDANPTDMANVPCGNGVSDYAVKVDPSGKDLLYMTYGYYTANSGPREFHEVLRKIVE